MLYLENTLWIGVKFCIVNGEMAQYMQRILPKHVIAPEIVAQQQDWHSHWELQQIVPYNIKMINYMQSPGCLKGV